MLRCLAIDDEPLALELLEDNISQIPFLQLIDKCSNALQAMKILQTEPIDLIFLDIQMPGLTGIQFLQSLTIKPMAILITAYEKFALEGFNLDVVDYLVKPVPFERFVKAAHKANELHMLRNRALDANAAAPTFFFVNVEYSLFKVVFADIDWIEGLKDYVKIHLKSPAKPVVTRMTLKSLEDQLPQAQFLRIHKSYIISISAITSIRKNSVFIGQNELAVSENYKEALTLITGKQT